MTEPELRVSPRACKDKMSSAMAGPFVCPSETRNGDILLFLPGNSRW